MRKFMLFVFKQGFERRWMSVKLVSYVKTVTVFISYIVGIFDELTVL